MIVEPEFASVLSVAERPGNTISPLIRRAWDGDKLQTITKNSPLCATDAHISMIGHITEDELRARITRTEWPTGSRTDFCSRSSDDLNNCRSEAPSSTVRSSIWGTGSQR